MFQALQHCPRLVPGPAERSLALAESLEALTADVRRRVGAQLSALLLVGGYARGEGGLVARGGELMPYNDLDLVVVVRDRPGSWRGRLAELGHDWSQRLGLDVDLWPIGERALREPPRTLFWLDVALGGAVVLAGDDAARSSAPLACRSVPLEEGARLLANRAVGLALSNLELEPSDASRPLRHVHKAAIACGDALLLATDRYRPSVRRRMQEVARLAGAVPELGSIARAYREAARFRLRPDLWTRPDDVDAWYRARVSEIAGWHLSFESWRLGAPRDALAYACWNRRLYPGLSDVSVAGRWLAPLRAGFTGAAPWGLVHPRERLARVAVLLAYAADDALAGAQARKLLGLKRAATRDEVHAAVLRLSAVGG